MREKPPKPIMRDMWKLWNQAIKLGAVKITKYPDQKGCMCTIMEHNGNEEIGIHKSPVRAMQEAIDLVRKKKEKNNE